LPDNTFIHLNVHTEYSLVDGILRINPMMEQARAMRMPALAVTEMGNMFSTIKFYRAAENQGVKPIIGAELRIRGHDDLTGRMTVLCCNTEGYRNLTRLITRSYTEGQHQGFAYVHQSWLHGHTRGLIALSGAQSGMLGQLLLNGNRERAREVAADYQQLFSDRFFLELQRCGRDDDERHVLQAVDLAVEMNLPVVATNAVRFLTREDFDAHEARVCINQGYTLSDQRRPRNYTDQQYLKSPEEMRDLFSDLPEAVTNTVAIATACNLELTLGEHYLPNFPVPDSYTQDDWLRKMAASGLEQIRVRKSIDGGRFESYRARLQKELDVIISMGFAGYFLIVADFIRWAKDNAIPVGPGRGSGAGSIVAYAIGITELDPIEYDLLFERFLNPERVSLPDFDVDFCMDRRDEVIEYVAGRYGREHVSQIITFGTMAAKAVVRDVGRVLAYPYGFVDQIAKLIPFDLNMTLERALAEEEQLQQRYEAEEEVRELIDLARKLEGMCRNAGRHAGGIVIAPRALTDYMPQYCEQGATSTVTQFDMGDVESIGLVKFDFLGLRTLTIIDWAVRDVNAMRAHEQKECIDIRELPLDDTPTYDLIRKKSTTAVFQLESDGMKKLIGRLQPDCFDDLIALVALFRPGPLQSGMVDDFVDRKHGHARVEYPHPDVEPILKPTYGVILYQEQVMQIAQVLAGYTLGAADLLRRAMGKKKPEEMAMQREIFTNGAVERGVGASVATYIFDLMEKFAGYGFNKSHSAAYALIAYQTAWLKAHYPAAFMAAVLSADMDNTDKITMLVDELRDMQLHLENPDINHSQYYFTVKNASTIRYGLGAIKGVGQGVIRNILDAIATDGPFTDLFNLCRRVSLQKLNRRVLEALIRSGALDALGPDRATMMASLDTAIQLAEQHIKNEHSGQDDFFGLDAVKPPAAAETDAGFVHVTPWSMEKRLQGEKETLGVYLNEHPIDRYSRELQRFVTTQLNRIQPGSVKVAGYIHRIRTRPWSRGKMAEVTIDDRTAHQLVRVMPEQFEKYRSLLVKDNLIIVAGEVEQDDYVISGYSIKARTVYSLDQYRNEFSRLLLRIPPEKSGNGLVAELKHDLGDHRRGRVPVILEYDNGTARCKMSLGDDWRVNASNELLQRLQTHLGEDNVALIYQ
jgi:DNA polymerase-3 subunit alpha